MLSAGLKIDWNAIPGLSKALADHTSGVSSIYSYDTCDKVWNDIEALRTGQAIFTQPAGIIKCAGGTCTLNYFTNSILNYAYSTAENHVDGLG